MDGRPELSRDMVKKITIPFYTIQFLLLLPLRPSAFLLTPRHCVIETHVVTEFTRFG